MISVIIPVYNVVKYLPRCLNSLENQTFSAFETILVDDGSTDGSADLCDNYCRKHPSAKVVHKPNGGLATARNAGMDAATGDYLIFLDSDDWLESNTLEILDITLSRFEAESIAYGYHMDYAVSGETIAHGFHVSEASHHSVQDAVIMMEEQELFNSVCDKVYSLRIIRENSLFFRKGSEPGEDLLFNCRYFQYVHFCVILPELFYHYMNQGETTCSNRYDPALPEKIEWFIQGREELYMNLGLTTQRSRELLDRCACSYRMISIYNAYHGDDRESAGSRRALLKSIFQDKTVARWISSAHTNEEILDSYQKIFTLLYKIHDPVLAELTYRSLFFAKEHMGKLYSRFRQSALK